MLSTSESPNFVGSRLSLFFSYLRDFTKKFNLKIRLNTNIVNVHREAVLDRKHPSRFIVTDQNGKIFTCKVLIVGTGPALPNTPDIEGIEVADTYQDHTLDLKEYENKKVLILGGGNSAFEVRQYSIPMISVWWRCLTLFGQRNGRAF